MSKKSEQQLENDLVKRLAGNGYERVMIPNVEALTNNFRNQMNILNTENLNGHDLTDSEFQRPSLTIQGKSIFESAKLKVLYLIFQSKKSNRKSLHTCLSSMGKLKKKN